MEHHSDDALSRIKELGRCEFWVSKAWYLTELSSITVSGVVDQSSTEENFVINAKQIHVEKK